MADRQDSDREVLTSLPRTRPVRRSDKRAKAPRTAAAPKTKKPEAAADGATAPRRKIPPAGYAAPTSQAPEDPVSASAELVATAIQAAGELTQIGYAVGRQTLRSMLDRLPRP